MNSVLRNKLDSRNARLMQAVDPDHLIEEAELKVQAREHEVTSARAPSYDKIRPCKLVELGYSPMSPRRSRQGTVPKPPKADYLDELVSPPRDNVLVSPRSKDGDENGVGGGIGGGIERREGVPEAGNGHGTGASGGGSTSMQRNLFSSARDSASSSTGTSAREAPRATEKSLEVANAKYKEAKQRLMGGSIVEALRLLEEASAACPEDLPKALQKIMELYKKAQRLTEVPPVEAADQAYRDAKAALRSGEAENALKLLNWAYTMLPSDSEGAARDKIFQLRALAESQVQWSPP